MAYSHCNSCNGNVADCKNVTPWYHFHNSQLHAYYDEHYELEPCTGEWDFHLKTHNN